MAHDIHAHGDIKIGDLPLNYIDEDGCRWIVQDVTGWWETPPAIIPEDERPYNEDGNYWTAGRYGPRTIQINGVVIPPPSTSELAAQRLISRARDKINREINLVRRTGVLTFYEVDATRQIEVQLLGQPLIATADGRNVLHFDIQFIASDPRKQSSEKRASRASMMGVGSGGVTYPRTYPRKYSAYTGNNRASVTNAGDTISYGSLRIFGPIINPRIDHAETGQFIKINITLGETDFLDIDMEKKTVTLNETVSRNADLDFDSTWFPYLPGDNTLLFTGTLPETPQEGWAGAANLVTNPSAESAGDEKAIHYNRMPDPSFTSEDTVPVVTRRNIAENPTFEPHKDVVENLVPNPSGRFTNGEVALWENLVPNPSGRIVDGTVTIRETRLPGFFGWDAATTTGITIHSPSHFTHASFGTTLRADVAVPEGATTFRVYFEARTSYEREGSDGGRVHFNSGGTTTTGTALELPADGEWHELDISRTISEGADTVNIGFLVSGYSSEQFDVRNPRLRFDTDPPIEPYWDAENTPQDLDPDLTPEWTGTPGASTSRLVAPKPVGFNATNGVVYYSKTYDSLALTGTVGGTPYVQATPLIYPAILRGVGNFTLLTEVLPTNPMSVRNYISEHIPDAQRLDVGVWNTVRNILSVESGWYCPIRLYAYNTGGTAYFRAALVPGRYPGPYFDGSSETSDPDLTYEWAGAEQESASRLVAPSPERYNTHRGVLFYSQSQDALAFMPTDIENSSQSFVQLQAVLGLESGKDYTLLTEAWTDSETAVAFRSYVIGGTGTGYKYFSDGYALVHQHFTSNNSSATVAMNVSIPETTGFKNGDIVYFRTVITPGTYTGPYFDGDEENLDPIEHAWTGEPNDSVSTRTTRSLPIHIPAPGTELESSAVWAATGDYSLKITPTTEDNNTYVDITPVSGFVSGQRYTISATMAEPTILKGDLHQNARSLVLTHSEGQSVATAPVGGGRASMVVTVPTNAQNVRLLAYNGSGINTSRGLDGVETVNEDSIYWDELAVIPGETRSDFFYYNSTPAGNEIYTLEDGVSVERRPSSRWWEATNNSSAYIDQQDTSDLVVEFVTGAEVETVPSKTFSANGLTAMSLGAMVTTSVDCLVTPYLFSDESSVPGQEVRVPALVPTYVQSTILVPDEQFKAGFAFSVASGTGTGLVEARLNSVILADGRYEGPYFDLENGLVGLETRQVGDAVGVFARDVVGFSPSPQANVYRSPEWKAAGQYSLVIQKTDSTIEVDTTYAELSSPAWSSLPNGDYTLLASVFAQPGKYLEGEEARTIEVFDGGTGTTYRTVQAPVGENTTLTLNFTKTSNTGHIRFISNALNGEKVFWDAILLTEGYYSDRYFDGDSEGATWDGARHSSSSTQPAREHIPAASLYTEHRDSWIK